MRHIAPPRQPPDERHQKQETADERRDRIAGNAEYLHRADLAVHERPPRPQGEPPERQVDALGFER